MPHHALYDPVRREAVLEVRPVVSCRETSMLEDPTLLDDETKKRRDGFAERASPDHFFRK